MPPDIRLTVYTDHDHAAVLGVELTDGMVYRIAAMLTQGDDNAVL